MHKLTRNHKDVLLAGCCMAFVSSLVGPLPLLALPRESSREVVRNWRAATHILPRPKPVQKLTDSYPDLGSSGAAAGGRLSYSLFLNSNGVSESEIIEYRPEACEVEPYRCAGKVLFQKSGNSLGHLLIAEVFGPEVLEDFLESEALKLVNAPGWGSGAVNVFYSGKLYNYTTWVFSQPGKVRSMSHFTVLVKNNAELRRRIQLAETCSVPSMMLDPLCSSP